MVVTLALLADFCVAQNGGAYAAEPKAAANAPVAAGALAPAQAQTDRQLKTISLTASRVGKVDLNRTAPTVPVMTSDNLNDNHAKNLKDALRDEAGVEVRRHTYRPSGIAGSPELAGRRELVADMAPVTDNLDEVNA
jgi:hemoglobin/transferrin/lactoferrin receptor protein